MQKLEKIQRTSNKYKNYIIIHVINVNIDKITAYNYII